MSLVQGFADRNGYGSENERKSSGDAFKFEVGCKPSKGRIGSQRCENARVSELG